MKIIADQSKCTGHGRCYALAPDLFDADEEGYVVVAALEIVEGTPQADLAARAVRNCPESALRLEN